MKNCPLIFLLGFNLTLYSQPDTALYQRLLLLVDSTSFNYDTTGISSLSGIPNPCDHTIRWNCYHIADVNSDRLNDLIFSGPCDPYSQTIIYINEGTGLKPAYTCAGKILSINKSTDATRINILKENCCCDYYSELIELTVDNHSEITKNSIYFHSDTEIQMGDSLVNLSFQGLMRTSPAIDDVARPDECSDDTIEGNKLLSIEKEVRLIQLHRNGNWRLVLFMENKARYWVGWVEILS